jgi:hypothetical protein
MDSINKTARTAGLLYSLMIPLGIFGILYVPSSIIVTGNINATIENILANEMVFRLSILTSLTLQVCHIFIVLLLYKLLKPVNKTMGLFMVIFMLVSVPISMVNELTNYGVLILLKCSNGMLSSGPEQLNTLVPLLLELHHQGINIASIFWGLWLFPMGYLVIKSGYIPKFLGYLLLLAGLGYMVDVIIVALFPESGLSVGAFVGWGEILFPLWLLIMGVKTDKWKQLIQDKEEF